MLIFIEEYEVLVEIIRFNEGFSLLFVECFLVYGIKIMEKICLDILEERVDVLCLDKIIYYFYNWVKELLNLKEIDILFVIGLEYFFF